LSINSPHFGQNTRFTDFDGFNFFTGFFDIGLFFFMKDKDFVARTAMIAFMQLGNAVFV
jgi:hypothetical protein